MRSSPVAARSFNGGASSGPTQAGSERLGSGRCGEGCRSAIGAGGGEGGVAGRLHPDGPSPATGPKADAAQAEAAKSLAARSRRGLGAVARGVGLALGIKREL
jgi:hypothetical protein